MLLEGVENKLTVGLKTIVVMDSYGSDLVERGKKCGVEILSMKAMEVSPSALPTSGGFPGGHIGSNVVFSVTFCHTGIQSHLWPVVLQLMRERKQKLLSHCWKEFYLHAQS